MANYLAQFDRDTKQLIAVVPADGSYSNYYKYVEMPEAYSPDLHEIVGDLDGFSFEPIRLDPRTEICRDFPPTTQMNIMRNMLHAIANKLGVHDPVFDDMHQFIESVLEKHHEQ